MKNIPGGYTGTAIMPDRKQAINAIMKSSDGGYTSNTVSPRVNPKLNFHIRLPFHVTNDSTIPPKTHTHTHTKYIANKPFVCFWMEHKLCKCSSLYI